MKEITKRKYEGYVWYSDKSEPKVLDKEDFESKLEISNPFIVEALLWCEEEKISVMVKHTGSYQVNEFDTKKLIKDGYELSEKQEYLSHKIVGHKKLGFQKLWKAEVDPLCEGFPVLVQKAILFTGFL